MAVRHSGVWLPSLRTSATSVTSRRLFCVLAVEAGAIGGAQGNEPEVELEIVPAKSTSSARVRGPTASRSAFGEDERVAVPTGSLCVCTSAVRVDAAGQDFISFSVDFDFDNAIPRDGELYPMARLRFFVEETLEANVESSTAFSQKDQA